MTPPADLDLFDRLAGGSAALAFAIRHWLHAADRVMLARDAWRVALEYAMYDDTVDDAADRIVNAARNAAHAGHEVARLLDDRLFTS